MRLSRAKEGKFVFSLNQAEQKVFLNVIELYPLVPGSHQPFSKSLQGRQAIEAQQMLDDALAEQRATHKRELDEWLKAKGRFRRTKSGCTFTVPHDRVEWLLQILNDIRIGSWLLLGSPEDRVDPEEIDADLQQVWVAMELSGIFQMALLDATERTSPG